MPMIVGKEGLLNRGAVQDEIIRRPLQNFVDLSQRSSYNPCQIRQRRRVSVLEMRLVALRQNPGLERKTRCIRLDDGEPVRVGDHARTHGSLLADDIAVNAALLQVEK